MSALEDELGVTLFERLGKSLKPTALAWSIQPDCQRFVSTYRQITARCEQERQGIEPALRLARDDALPEDFWRGLMRQLKQRFPMTGISVYLAPPQELPELVATEVVDLAFGLGVPGVEEISVTSTSLGGLRQWMVVSQQHPLARLPQVCPEDLAAHSQVTLAFVGADEQLVPDLTGSGNYLALTQFELIRDAVMEGTGWAWLPQPLIDEALQAGRLKVVKTEEAILWHVFRCFERSGGLKGQVASWLESQLVSYLSRFS